MQCSRTSANGPSANVDRVVRSFEFFAALAIEWCNEYPVRDHPNSFVDTGADADADEDANEDANANENVDEDTDMALAPNHMSSCTSSIWFRTA